MQWLILLALACYVAVDGTAQGKIAWLMREWVPVEQQGKVGFALHVLYPICYGIATALLFGLTLAWPWPVVAVLMRVALFDPFLQWARGDKLFSVGTSAKLDVLVGKVSWLSLVLRVVSLVGAVTIVWLLL